MHSFQPICQWLQSNNNIVTEGIFHESWPRAAEPEGLGVMGAVSPPPHFLKVEKVPFFWAKVPHLKNEKSIS